jgi:hypothetical protein
MKAKVLKAVGFKGVYMLASFQNPEEVEQIEPLAEKWRQEINQ